MNLQRLLRFLWTMTILALLVSCGGGGGGNSGGAGGGGSSLGGQQYLVTAQVSRDSCGERLSNVQQYFTVGDSAGGTVVDTTFTQYAVAEQGNSLSGSFSETNGDCTRTYSFQLSGLGSSNGTAVLLSHTSCPTGECETEWQGTALTVGTRYELYSDDDTMHERIRGEACNANVPPTVGYRPSLFECNGNAAVLLTGNQRNNYSVVVRRNGQFNDRDPNNPSCGTNRCSPFKTQKRIELAEHQVNCLGGSGFSAQYSEVQRISIKYTAQVLNPNDVTQFEQYCLGDKQASFN